MARQATIARITRYRIVRYSDTGQVNAYAHWIDSRGKEGTTGGCPCDAHMTALRERALRELGFIQNEANWREDECVKRGYVTA